MTPRLDEQLCFRLYTASRLVTRAYRPLLEPLGLTYPQYLVMLLLWEADQARDEPTVSQLGARLALDSGTVTPLLKRLERAGLVVRQRQPHDERVVRVALTYAGRALAEDAAGVPRDLLCRLGGNTDLAALVDLRDRLDELLAHLRRT